MNKEIRDEFIEGVNEVYATLFTDGVTDGAELFLLDETNTFKGFYKESKVKRYKKPFRLVTKVVTKSVSRGDSNAEDEMKNCPTFTVTYKSLRDNGIPCETESDWDYLKRGYIRFHGDFYEIKNVRANTFVSDVFLTMIFECEFRKDVLSVWDNDSRLGYLRFDIDVVGSNS